MTFSYRFTVINWLYIFCFSIKKENKRTICSVSLHFVQKMVCSFSRLLLQPLLPEILGWAEEVRERNYERCGGILLRAMNGNQRNQWQWGNMIKKENKVQYADQKDGKRKNKINKRKKINEVLAEKFILDSLLVCPSTLLGGRTGVLEYPDTPLFILAFW